VPVCVLQCVLRNRATKIRTLSFHSLSATSCVSFQDTNRNLRAVDKMLENYRDVGEQKAAVVDLVSSIDAILVSRRIGHILYCDKNVSYLSLWLKRMNVSVFRLDLLFANTVNNLISTLYVKRSASCMIHCKTR